MIETALTALMKIAISMVYKLLTEKFVSRMVVLGMRKLSESTDNTLDDDVTKAVDEALGYPVGKPTA